MDQVDEDSLARARRIIAAANHLVLFTGAGVSADSGVPTFRGAAADALWGKYNPQQLASAEGFASDPELVYGWYSWRRTQLARVEPNPAHHTIAGWQRDRGAVVITQNVDGLHERVAPKDAAIHRLHGTLLEDRCCHCTHRQAVDLSAPPALRSCEHCGRWMRPAVVWFGEMLDPAIWQAAEQAVDAADVLLVVGTSGSVWPAAGLVDRATRASGAALIVVNAERTSFDESAAIALHGRAADIVPRLRA